MTTQTTGAPLIFRKDLGTTLEEETWNIPHNGSGMMRLPGGRSRCRPPDRRFAPGAQGRSIPALLFSRRRSSIQKDQLGVRICTQSRKKRQTRP